MTKPRANPFKDDGADAKRRKLDEKLKKFRGLGREPPPPNGWARAIREGLGMTVRQLGDRTGLSRSAVATMERSEAGGTIQLNSLRKLAQGLECDLAYALVPRLPLAETVKRRQQILATKDLYHAGGRLAHREFVALCVAYAKGVKGKRLWDEGLI